MLIYLAVASTLVLYLNILLQITFSLLDRLYKKYKVNRKCWLLSGTKKIIELKVCWLSGSVVSMFVHLASVHRFDPEDC